MNDIKKEFLKDDILKVISGYFTSTVTMLTLRDDILEVVEKYLPDDRREDDLK